MDIVYGMLNTLAGIIASFLLFWGSAIPWLQSHIEPSLTSTSSELTSTTTAASEAPDFPAASSTPAKSQEDVRKSGLPASGGLAETGDPRTFTTPPAAKNIPTTSAPEKSETEVNDETRAALVNIFCIPHVGINGISGSGVVVDGRGVILTNAHVAQYLLLRDYLTPGNINCTVRTGSPAQERYIAKLLYLPPSWISANASQLRAAQATGTGEDDFAFLLIVGRTDPAATLPASFARLRMDRGLVDIGEEMLLAAYPAGFLGGETVQKSLYASSAIAYVTQLFSFGTTRSVDLFSVGGTVVSQGGSSGGAAVRLHNGTLAGIIATETTAASTGQRDLRAISLAHIDDTLAATGQGGITTLLSGDLAAKATEFNIKIAPGLTAQLEAVLKGD